MCIFPQYLARQIKHKDELINLAVWKNAPIMNNITVDIGREQLLLLLSSSRAIYTIPIWVRIKACKYLRTERNP